MGRTEAVCWVGRKLEAIIALSWAGREEKKNFYLGLTLYLRQEGELYFLPYHSLGFQDLELRLTLLELNTT